MKNESSKDIQVAPEGNYALVFAQTPYFLAAQDSHTGEALPWVELGEQKRDKKGFLSFPIQLNISGIKDGRSLNATVIFSATAAENNATATEGEVALSAVLESVPSMVKSTMTINGQTGKTVEITEGQEVQIEIAAKDTDGLPITESRGRFFDIMWQLQPDEAPETKATSFNKEAGVFFLTLSSLHISKAGEYR